MVEVGSVLWRFPDEDSGADGGARWRLREQSPPSHPV